jgi:hypothetical protein
MTSRALAPLNASLDKLPSCPCKEGERAGPGSRNGVSVNPRPIRFVANGVHWMATPVCPGASNVSTITRRIPSWRIHGPAPLLNRMRRKNNPTVGFTLTQIAEGFVNEDAAEEWQAQDSGGALARTAEWARSAPAGASRQLANDVRRAAATVGIAQKGSRKRSGGQRGRRK